MTEPTAVHAVADVHDTALMRPPPMRLGVDDQLVPFQRSADSPPGPTPTAVQAVAEVHDTALRLVVVGLGVVWIDQLVPFQASTSVPPVPALFEKPPTAMQAVGVVHDTPVSSLDVVPAGLGVDWIDQLVPFQCSTSIPGFLGSK